MIKYFNEFNNRNYDKVVLKKDIERLNETTLKFSKDFLK